MQNIQPSSLNYTHTSGHKDLHTLQKFIVAV